METVRRFSRHIFRGLATRLGKASRLAFFFLMLAAASGCQYETPVPPGRATLDGRGAPRYVGFSVMGPDWRVEEVFANETERLSYLEKQGYLIAQHTSRLNGNMVRVPIYMWNVLGSGLPSATARLRKPLYQIDTATILTTLEETARFLRASLAGMEKDRGASGQSLRWQQWDALLAGIHRYNTELAADPAKYITRPSWPPSF